MEILINTIHNKFTWIRQAQLHLMTVIYKKLLMDWRQAPQQLQVRLNFPSHNSRKIVAKSYHRLKNNQSKIKVIQLRANWLMFLKVSTIKLLVIKTNKLKLMWQINKLGWILFNLCWIAIALKFRNLVMLLFKQI